jgi:hypothetical protein
MSQRRLGEWFHRHRKAPDVQQRFLTFMHERQNDSFRALLVRMKARIDSGDNEGLARSPVDASVLEQEFERENEISFDSLVEEFLSAESS